MPIRVLWSCFKDSSIYKGKSTMRDFEKRKKNINEYNTYRAVPMLCDSLRNSPKIHESSCKLLKSSYPRIPEVIMLIMFLSESNSIPSGHCLRYRSYASPGIPLKKIENENNLVFKGFEY